MEFRSCPSCKASVLEDDAADCPFCGASMSGKPTAKPAAKPASGPAARPTPRTAPPADGRPAAPNAPAQRGAPAAKSPASPGPVRARPEPEEDRPADDSDPFEVDPLAHKQATSVAIKPGKGRTIEVKCPMCETVGYIGSPQAGKDVKCCNPSCKLPIFKAPKLPPVVKAGPEKPKGLSMGVISALAVLGIGACAGALYWFVLREDPTSKKPVANTPVEQVEKTPEKELLPNEVIVPEKHVVSTHAEIRKLALQDILKVTVKAEFRSKPYGRQLAAEALMLTGDLKGAQEQISKIGPGGVQYAVEPLALLAQLKLDAGDKAGATAVLQEAVDKVEKHPDVLRSHLDAVVVLAATLVRFDRSADAVSLLNRFARSDTDARATLSEIWRASIDQGTFDFAKEQSLGHLQLCGKPLWVAATVQLCHQRQWDQALAWSRSIPDVVTRDASLAACAGMMTSRLVAKSDAALASKLKEAIAAADLAAKVRMQAATVDVRLMLNDKSVTAAQVTEIEQLLTSTQIPPPAVVPGMKAIYESKGTPYGGLPDPGPGTSLALAFADIVNLKMKLGDMTGGWATQLQAMELLRAVSPSPATARSLFEKSKSTGIINQLGQLLGFPDDENKKRRALSQYRGQCEEVLKVAETRFAIQQTLLRRSMKFGLLQEVWQFIQDFSQVAEAQQEPYRSEDSLMIDLYYTALSLGKEDFLKQKWGELTPKEQQAINAAVKTVGVLANSIKTAQSGDVRKAAGDLKPLYEKTLYDRNLVDRHVLNQVSMLAEKSVTDSYQYVQRLFDPTIREDAMHLLAGLSIRMEKGSELWMLIQEDRVMPATDRATAYLGFLEGIQAAESK